MNDRKQPLLIGGNAHIRLQLYNAYKADMRIIEQARLNVIKKLRTPAFANASVEEALDLYKKEKECLIKKDNKDLLNGLIGAFDKSKNI